MKKVLVLIGFVFLGNISKGQGAIEVMLEQIGANEAYIITVEKGYNIMKAGWNMIGSLKNAHFSIDKGFFTSLSAINPRVKNYARVGDIIDCSYRIASEVGNVLSQIGNKQLFSDPERQYVKRIVSNMTVACGELLDNLTALLSPGEMNMSDDERIKEIDILYASMKDRTSFLKSFSDDLNKLMLQRLHDANEGNELKSFYNIK